ncbi:hypothetical protein SAMN04488128_104372 [Chitinophaga eiseniae]|uniref:Class I lanthipeptide n=1 Tax=Chitinophaga eiseniae TaxID=634771 RepID=A0A1T4TCC0_9BACT|nr:class I lanthipeptide [Chitinophaga eiseniae]SKA37981.1 hypothetical protein SAMN04488128_104372 [Chitinophaga eiseniae]
MKKKTTIGKKMSFNKTTIAQLNPQQQAEIAGGIPTTTITISKVCKETRYETCNTFPYTQEICVFC